MGFSFTSFLFEVVNFVVLVAVLARFVYRPLRDGIAARRREHEELVASAKEQAKAAEQALEEARASAMRMNDARERALREATEDAAEARARMLEQAKDDAASALAQGRKLLATERAEASDAARELAIEQSVQLAARLLGELAPSALDEAMVERLAREVHERGRSAFARAAPVIDLRFARPPSPSILARLRAAFTEVLGGEPTLTTSEDAALVGGVIARIGDHVLDASVAGNLALLAARARELTAEETR